MAIGGQSERVVMSEVTHAAAEYGLDFSVFHPETVNAQVRSRARAFGVPVQEYVGTLGDARLEIETLRRAVMDTPGLFYRDPEGWDYLEQLLAKEWRDVSSEVQIRAWVPNCGSGEDAYTLAMVLAQVLGNPEDLAPRTWMKPPLTEHVWDVIPHRHCRP
jgi:two-component system, chemotaxis family, CheB/CheR fusion protein